MSVRLLDYVKGATGRAIDVDGIYGAQCWDLWSDYAQALGVPFAATVTRAGAASPHPGYACNVIHNAQRVPAIRDHFEQLPADAVARAGDVAFWERDRDLYTGSHVAIVLEDAGERLLTLSQNPGPPARVYLPKRTLLGYLRPRPGLLAPEPGKPKPAASAPGKAQATITREDPLMAYRILRQGTDAHFENAAGVVEVLTPAHLKMLLDVDRQAARTPAGQMVDVGPTQLRTLRDYHRKARNA